LHQKTLEEIGAVEEAVMGYLAAVSYADGMLGRLLDALESSEYKDNTVVIVWSDQGYHHGEKGQWGKHTLWKETSHVPLIFAGTNLPKGETVDATVGLIDLYPTLIELCELPEQHKMDGESLLSSIMKPSSAKDKMVFVPSHERGSYAVINSGWRYIYYHDGTEELYNLEEDPNEWYNLAEDEKYQGIKEKMKKAAPTTFREAATSSKDLKLVIEGDSFYWEGKNGILPQLEL
jgi:arylsulfatase A-like enzyme